MSTTRVLLKEYTRLAPETNHGAIGQQADVIVEHLRDMFANSSMSDVKDIQCKVQQCDSQL